VPPKKEEEEEEAWHGALRNTSTSGRPEDQFTQNTEEEHWSCRSGEPGEFRVIEGRRRADTEGQAAAVPRWPEK
jgi:hypothetical protein